MRGKWCAETCGREDSTERVTSGGEEQRLHARTLESNHLVSNPTSTTYWPNDLVRSISSFYKMGIIINTFFKGLLGRVKKKINRA